VYFLPTTAEEPEETTITTSTEDGESWTSTTVTSEYTRSTATTSTREGGTYIELADADPTRTSYGNVFEAHYSTSSFRLVLFAAPDSSALELAEPVLAIMTESTSYAPQTRKFNAVINGAAQTISTQTVSGALSWARSTTSQTETEAIFGRLQLPHVPTQTTVSFVTTTATERTWSYAIPGFLHSGDTYTAPGFATVPATRSAYFTPDLTGEFTVSDLISFEQTFRHSLSFQTTETSTSGGGANSGTSTGSTRAGGGDTVINTDAAHRPAAIANVQGRRVSMSIYRSAGAALGDELGDRYDFTEPASWVPLAIRNRAHAQTFNLGDIESAGIFAAQVTLMPSTNNFVTVNSDSVTWRATTDPADEDYTVTSSSAFQLAGEAATSFAGSRVDLAGGKLAQGETAIVALPQNALLDPDGALVSFSGENVTYSESESAEPTFYRPCVFAASYALQVGAIQQVISFPRNDSALLFRPPARIFEPQVPAD
jgi:hypothetical protein